MILDSFTLYKVIFQIQYDDAYEIWDRAGAIARRLSEIWPELKVKEGQPQLQTLVGKDVEVQTGFSKSTVTISGTNALEHRRVQQLKETFEAWRDHLELATLKRISTRALYARHFDSIREANATVIGLGLVKWPDQKVFDQPQEADLNGIDVAYRFEDEQSFALLRIKAEQITYEVNLDPYFIEDSDIKNKKNRMLIDFDRGILGETKAEKIRVDEWIKGFLHVLNRDIEKVLRV